MKRKDTIDEQALIKELKKDHNSEAFGVMVAQYQERIYWHIRGIVKNHEDSDDVLQNVFIKVFKNIKKFNEDSALYTWIYRVATNESLTFLKKRAKRLQIDDEALQDQMLDNLESDVYFSGNEIQMKLQEAIKTLPEKQRLVFQMRYFQEIKYEDLSTILDTSVGALKSSYHIAVKKITEFLKDV